MNDMKVISCTKEIAGRNVTLETGKVARQATGSVVASSGDTKVLVTVVAGQDKSGMGFFPLTVNYIEKFYASGKIPGSFFRREGRPSEKEVLTSRLIDRPIRPLFPKGFGREVQIICTVLSMDKNDDADVISIIGASAALQLSGLPFQGPLSAAKVGFIDGNYTLNPSLDDLKESSLNMMVAGSQDAIFMVESEAKELSEDQMLGAILFAQAEMKPSLELIEELVSQANVTPIEYEAEEEDAELKENVKSLISEELTEAYQIAEKASRQEKISELKEKVKASFEEPEDEKIDEALSQFKSLESEIVRSRLLSGESRIDGRDLDTVRPISIEVGALPQAHGSALFTRGETQSISVATMDSLKLSQLIDSLHGDLKDPFMLHYNFPPFSVGEAGMVGSPKRREIGHGKLARRALEAVLPNPADFEYAIRVVSEITESNGSSSMATVCASSLAMMDAGIPLKKPVAGVAMGLVKTDDQHCVITDILGDEDHLGDMDFKVAGTDEGVTALQMDIKVTGITEEIMKVALDQALDARRLILKKMDSVIDKPRSKPKDNAPKIQKIQIDKSKIREVIGTGGKIIREICDTTGAKVEIDDNGQVLISSLKASEGDAALKMISDIVAEPEVGKIYEGKVVKTMDFGAFVNFLGNRDGLVHISQLKEERVEKTTDVVNEGDMVKVKVIGVDDRGKVKLSIKDV